MGLRLARLWQVSLACSELKRTIEFYRDVLNIEFVGEFSPPGLGCFRLVPTGLVIETRSPEDTSGTYSGGVLYFAVDDIDSAYAELTQKGVSFDSAPHLIFRDDAGTFGRKGAETWMAFFKDPDGNILALATSR